jgi:hypothetical protein
LSTHFSLEWLSEEFSHVVLKVFDHLVWETMVDELRILEVERCLGRMEPVASTLSSVHPSPIATLSASSPFDAADYSARQYPPPVSRARVSV